MPSTSPSTPGSVGHFDESTITSAPVTDRTASSGALASGLDRLVSLPVMAVIAIALAITGHRLLPDAEVDDAAPEPEPATDTA